MSQNFVYPSGASNTVIIPPGGATAANQSTQIGIETNTQNSVASIDSKTPTQGQKTMASSSPVVIASDQSPVPVTISGGLANPLPVQDSAAEASLASIDSKLTNPLPVSGPLTDAQLRATPVPVSGTVVTGGLTDAQLRASPVPTSTSNGALETTQLAFSAKSASAFVNVPFDETVITYVGATTNIATVVYKLAAATVQTLTLTYDGSNRLIDVLKS
jgi:hypothetical protein